MLLACACVPAACVCVYRWARVDPLSIPTTATTATNCYKTFMDAAFFFLSPPLTFVCEIGSCRLFFSLLCCAGGETIEWHRALAFRSLNILWTVYGKEERRERSVCKSIAAVCLFLKLRRKKNVPRRGTGDSKNKHEIVVMTKHKRSAERRRRRERTKTIVDISRVTSNYEFKILYGDFRRMYRWVCECSRSSLAAQSLWPHSLFLSFSQYPAK